MNTIFTEFKRKFSISMHKNLKIKLGEMSFFKDFTNNAKGDMYPVIQKSDNCSECVKNNQYILTNGNVQRLICQFFPYASYELTAKLVDGKAGFTFKLPEVSASVLVSGRKILFVCEENKVEAELPDFAKDDFTMVVSCRPGSFDVYFRHNGKAEFVITFNDCRFDDSNLCDIFSDSYASLNVSGRAVVKEVLSYIDNGISIADIRPVRYENSDVLTENGRIYFTATIRCQYKYYQGVFSWVPGTDEWEMSGALFFDYGDGRWCDDVATSLLYHREEKKWYLWVCAFSHGHFLGHSEFEGDPRFGVNIIDIELMEKASEGSEIYEFKGFVGDEDPDFFFDSERNKWLMSICRINPETKEYSYVFFESDDPFEGYKYIGKGHDGCETGGSFVKADGELFFVCGNSFSDTSDYRIYSKDGMNNAKFNYPDGGFRGWGTVVPIKQGSRTRYYWLTFDRHNGSDYNWSYGNLYCFEAE